MINIMTNIDDLFTLVKVIGNNDFYLLLPGKVDIDSEDGKKIVKEAVKRKMPHNLYMVKYMHASFDEVKISDLSLSEYLIYINALKEVNII